MSLVVGGENPSSPTNRRKPCNIMLNELVLETFLNQVDTTGEHWLWTGLLNKKGYGKFSRIIDDHQDWIAHRASYRLFVGTITDDLLVCHTCNIRNCVKPSHLYLGTPLQNTQHAVECGNMRGNRGTTNGSSKLDDDKVIEIRKIHREGSLSCAKLGKMYSVSNTTIHSIVNGSTWKHLKEESI